MTEDLRYPLGKFEWVPPENAEQMAKRRAHYIDVISKLPDTFSKAVSDLSPTQLDTPYRPEGWTVRQLAHHVPDSHANAYIRFKLALTEYEPTIKPYKEDMWAKLADTANTPVEVSLQMLSSIHTRWVAILRSMDSSDFARPLRHPEIGVIDLNRMLALYAWHSAHHTAHVTSLRKRMGWG
jgi:uncharacterized damage-inducible protein DinB